MRNSACLVILECFKRYLRSDPVTPSVSRSPISPTRLDDGAETLRSEDLARPTLNAPVDFSPPSEENIEWKERVA